MKCWPILMLGLLALAPSAQGGAFGQRLDPPLRGFLQAYAGGRPDQTTRVIATEVELQKPGAKQYLVYLSGPGRCGSGGCDLLVVEPQGYTYRVLSKSTVTWPPIKILPTRTRGWSDLAVMVSGGGVESGFARLSFDGRGYTTNPTLAPRVPTLSGRVVISADYTGDRLYP